MTIESTATNPYGYQGHLSEVVIRILDIEWPWSAHEDCQLKLARGRGPFHASISSFDDMLDQIVERMNRNPILIAAESQLRAQSEFQTLEKAGYAYCGKIDADRLWADLKTAGLVSVRRDEMEGLKPWGAWWYFNDLRLSHFDAEGLLIARGSDYFAGDESRAIAIVAENVRNTHSHERGNPRTPDEALLDASIGPRLASAVNLDQPK